MKQTLLRHDGCGVVGAGIGAALGGMRPIVEIMTVNFSLLALDHILNNAATLCHMSGGQLNVPLVIRMATGARDTSPPALVLRTTRNGQAIIRMLVSHLAYTAGTAGPSAHQGNPQARDTSSADHLPSDGCLACLGGSHS